MKGEPDDARYFLRTLTPRMAPPTRAARRGARRRRAVARCRCSSSDHAAFGFRTHFADGSPDSYAIHIGPASGSVDVERRDANRRRRRRTKKCARAWTTATGNDDKTAPMRPRLAAAHARRAGAGRGRRLRGSQRKNANRLERPTMPEHRYDVFELDERRRIRDRLRRGDGASPRRHRRHWLRRRRRGGGDRPRRVSAATAAELVGFRPTAVAWLERQVAEHHGVFGVGNLVENWEVRLNCDDRGT